MTDSPPAPPNGVEDSLRRTVGAAPVVARVQMATLALKADDWARLEPGDTLATDVDVGADVHLVVAGRVVARGELVDVDGKLGVRLRSLEFKQS